MEAASVLGLAWVFAAAGARAETPPPALPAAPVQRVEVVGGASSADAERRDSTTAKVVVGRDDIERFGDSSVSDVMRRVPGVTVASKPSGGTEVRLNGMGAGYTQVLLNGEPAPPGFSLESLSPSMIERIEVQRVATANQSAQAIAGTVNIVLRQTIKPAQRRAKLTAGGPTGQQTYLLSGDLSQSFDGGSYNGTGYVAHDTQSSPTTLRQSDVADDGSDLLARRIRQRNVDLTDKIGVTGTVQWKFPSNGVLKVEPWISARAIRTIQQNERITDLGAPSLYPQDDMHSVIHALLSRVNLSWHQDLQDEASLDVKVGNRYNWILGKAHLIASDEDRGTLLDEHVRGLTVERALTLAGSYRAPFVDSHAFELGWDGMLQRLGDSRRQTEVAPPGYPQEDLDESNDVQISRLALYAQDDWEIDKTASVYAGLRWEGLETRTTGNSIDTTTNRSSVFSPILQLRWRPGGARGNQFRLAVSRTYKAPLVEELNPRRRVANDNTPTTPNTQGNPDLLPELAWGLNLAMERFLERDGGLLSASAYARRISNVVLPSLRLVDGAWVSMPVNQGTATAAGVELESKVSLRNLDPAWPRLQLRANVSWNWSRLHEVPPPDNRLKRQSPLSASTGADYSFNDKPLTMGASFTFDRGGRFRASPIQFDESSAVRTLDAYALWKFTNSASLRVSATNLLGQDRSTGTTVHHDAATFDQVSDVRTWRAVRVTLDWPL